MVGTWYLKAFTVDLGDPEYITAIDAPQNPTFTIHPDYSFEGLGACNTFSGQLVYDGVEEVYYHESFANGVEDCGTPGYNDFETQYFCHFNDGCGLYLRYVPLGNGILYLELPSPGFGMEFQDTPFLGLNETPITAITVFPTPTVNKLQLNPQHIEIKSLSIYTLSGQKIMTLYDVPESIDVSALQSGLYVLEFVTDKGKTFKKFIKK